MLSIIYFILLNMAVSFTSPFRKKMKDPKYVDSSITGISRMKRGKGFSYYDQKKRKITDSKTISRIKSLVIPPNWKDVWICPFANGHIQATGTDARGRKQYIYHENWVQLRNDDKFALLLPFGKGLPNLKKEINKDLNREKQDLKKISALALKVMELTSMRSGNKFYLKENGSYGLTTLKNKHLTFDKNEIIFKYVGKKGVKQEKHLKKKKLIPLLQQLKEIPGSKLFQYYDDNQKVQPLEASHLNAYLHEIFQEHITCKIFRTWNACFISMEYLLSQGPVESKKQRVKIAHELIKQVAVELGNTIAVAKKNYILPQIISDYQDGKLNKWLSINSKHTPSKRSPLIRKKLLKLIGAKK